MTAKGEAPLGERLKEALAGYALGMEGDTQEPVLRVQPGNVAAVCAILKEKLGYSYLRCLSGVDYKEYLEVVYHLYAAGSRSRLVVKTRVSPEKPEVPSVTPVWKGADWHEREAAEMFGLTFAGHPHPGPLLLEADYPKYPLLKGYRLPEPEGKP